MKKQIDYVMSFFIVVILLIEYRFFFLLPIPNMIQRTMTYHNKVLLFLLSIFLFVMYGMYRKKLLFSKYVYGYIMLISISAFYAYIKYQPNLSEIILPMFAYLSLLLYFPLRRYFKHHFSFFISTLTGMNIIANLLLLAQLILYRITFNVFMYIYEFYNVGRVYTRDGDIRITYLGTIISFSCVISMGFLFFNKEEKKLYKNSKFIHIVNVVLSLAYFQLVSQTRMYVLVLIGTFVFLIYFHINSKNIVFSMLKQVLFFTGIIIVIYSTGVLDYLINLIIPFFDGSSVEDGSYYARMEALSYFSSVISRNPVFGNGLLSPDRSSLYYNIITGPMGYAFYTDVGILGTTAQFGIPMLVWYVFLLKKIYYVYNKQKNKIIFSLLVFMMLSSGTLIVLDPQRIVFLTLALSVIDYLDYDKINSVDKFY